MTFSVHTPHADAAVSLVGFLMHVQQLSQNTMDDYDNNVLPPFYHLDIVR